MGVKIYWTGLETLMQSPEISKIEQDLMMQKLGQIEASFLQEFGFQGKFEIKSRTTSGIFKRGGRYHGGRTSWRIVAADAKTGAALKRQPGWLGRFI